jgi:hypothetical protein
MSGTAGNGLYADRHFQNAYTTRTLMPPHACCRAPRNRVVPFHPRYPFGPDATIHIALAWAGDVMIELHPAERFRG